MGLKRRETPKTWGDVLVEMGFDMAAASHLMGSMDLHTRDQAERGTRRANALAIMVALVEVALEACPEVRTAYQPAEDIVKTAVALIAQSRPTTTLEEIGLLFGGRTEATMKKWGRRGWRGLPVPALRVGALLVLTLGRMGVTRRRDVLDRMVAAARQVTDAHPPLASEVSDEI